jgi:hypothetical protein
MPKNLILTVPLFIIVAIASGCGNQMTTVPEAEFGDAVRNVMEYQIHDYEAALHPTPNAIEGIDPDRINAVIDEYRSDVSATEAVQQPISISVPQ